MAMLPKGFGGNAGRQAPSWGVLATGGQRALKATMETAAKTVWTTGYRAKNRNATRKKAETAYLVAKATGTVLKANDTLKAMARKLQTGTACRAQLTSQYNGYVKGNSRTDEKTFMRQEQDTATVLVGISGIAASVGDLAIGGAGVTATGGAGMPGTVLLGSLKAKLMATLNKLSEIAGRAAKAGKLTYLTNLVEDMKKKIFGDEEKFPVNPNDFNPKGLVKREYKNGEIINGMIQIQEKRYMNGIKILNNGDHYHYTPDGKTRMPNDLGETHLKAGDIVPPYDNKE